MKCRIKLKNSKSLIANNWKFRSINFEDVKHFWPFRRIRKLLFLPGAIIQITIKGKIIIVYHVEKLMSQLLKSFNIYDYCSKFKNIMFKNV